MKERETVELSKHIIKSFLDEDYELYDKSEDLGFEHIEENIIYTDMEKAYTTEQVILKRNIDKKYFAFTYTKSEYYGLDEMNFPFIANEVFPETITKIIYN